MARMFLAVDISTVDKDNVANIATSINQAGFRRINQENYHLTLAFLGEINADTQAKLTTIINHWHQHFKPKRFDYIGDHISLFTKPQVCYLGISQPPKALVELADELTLQAKKIGYAPHHTNFTPHISLYRKAKSLPHLEYVSVKLLAISFSLYHSISTTTDVEYRRVKSWLLTP